MENKNFSRRAFLVKAGSSVAALTVSAAVLGSGVRAMSRALPAEAGPIALDLKNDDYKVLAETGGAMKIPDSFKGGKPIIVIRTSDSAVSAFSSRCTHWGCELPLPINNIITCKCHGAVFSSTGKVTKGPAKKDLQIYQATLEGSVITIRNTSDNR